nr:transglutaminase-like domain-containing protein [Microbulbifer elongatus]
MVAQNIKSKGEGVAAISNWLGKNIVDVGYVAEDRGALYAITNRKGDCTEFSTAFVALARASQIPSRVVGGFVLEQSGRLQAENYHNWSEFKRDGKWNIADPQNNIVDSGYGLYVAFYNFNKHSRMSNSHRFLSYDSRLSVQML